MLSQLVTPVNTKSLNSYQSSIRAACRGLHNSSFDKQAFKAAMTSAINRGFEQAWRDGAKTCGIKPDERTEDEDRELTRFIGSNLEYVSDFGGWIIEHRESKSDVVFSRADMWIGRYEEVRAKAQVMACKDGKSEWVLGPTEKHCKDCSSLANRVYRNSTWEKYDILPRSWRLSCKGRRCKCELKQADKPVTRGKPPSIG